MNVSQARAIVRASQQRRARQAALPPAWRDDEEGVIFCRSHRQYHEVRWWDCVPRWVWAVAATDAAWIIAGIAGEIAGVM